VTKQLPPDLPAGSRAVASNRLWRIVTAVARTIAITIAFGALAVARFRRAW